MTQHANDTYRFDLGHTPYQHVRRLGWLFFASLILCSGVAITLGVMLWKTYTHDFTPYLKWQDALVSLSWFIAFVASGGCILIIRFLYALRAGYTRGMLTLDSSTTLTVRDLSSENLKSIFWIMNSAFWCFFVVLVGLLPLILIGWTLSMPNLLLVILTTGIAIVLSLAGFVVSVISASFIVIGCIGGLSFGRKLGSSHIYQLNGQAAIRIDNFVLTIIYPGTPESMVDLNLLAPQDQRRLLALLHKRWVDAEQVWNPTLGEEIAQALEDAEHSAILV